MRWARLEIDRLARLDLDAALHFAHLRHALIHRHLVNLESGRGIRRAAEQPIGLGPGVPVVAYPAPIEAPLGVARDQGFSITIEPTLYSAAVAPPAIQPSSAAANTNEYFDGRVTDVLQVT
jgi:hypothetical protein